MNLAAKCGNREKAAFAKAEAGKLPKKILWFHDSQLKLPGTTRTQTKAVIQAAFQIANLYVPIEFARTRTAKNALIVLMLGPPEEFDGSGGILAMADMRSLYDPIQREIWYDPGDSWAWGKRQRDAAIFMLPVTCHEIGHTAGFGHIERDGALMNQFYDPQITTPSREELALFDKRYPELKGTTNG